MQKVVVALLAIAAPHARAVQATLAHRPRPTRVPLSPASTAHAVNGK